MSILNLPERINRLMIFNVKGGVGKTSIALNLALRFGYGVVTNDRFSLIDRVFDILPRLKLLGFWDQAEIAFVGLISPNPREDAPSL